MDAREDAFGNLECLQTHTLGDRESAYKRALKNIEYLQTCILCERGCDFEAANRGLIEDIIVHESTKRQFTYVFAVESDHILNIMQYNSTDGSCTQITLRISMHMASYMHPLRTRDGHLLFIDRHMRLINVVDPNDNFCSRVLPIDKIRKTTRPIQNGDVVFLFCATDKSVCTLDTSTGTFTDWKGPIAFPSFFSLWTAWSKNHIVAAKSHIFFMTPKNSHPDSGIHKYCCSSMIFSFVVQLPQSVYGGFACCLLDDENILLTGGFDDSDNNSLACFVYNIEKNTWSTFAPMNAKRMGHTITTLGNGDVMVIGGCNYLELVESYEVYSKSTEKWSIFSKSHFGNIIGVVTI